jgi:hypothetical protein
MKNHSERSQNITSEKPSPDPLQCHDPIPFWAESECEKEFQSRRKIRIPTIQLSAQIVLVMALVVCLLAWTFATQTFRLLFSY